MGGVRVGKYFKKEWYERFSGMFLDILKNKNGLTHFELLEYLLLIIMVVGVVLVLGTSFSEVQAKIWAKLHNELLNLN
jgi:high-affinity Fe2+/Pb2+ permease